MNSGISCNFEIISLFDGRLRGIGSGGRRSTIGIAGVSENGSSGLNGLSTILPVRTNSGVSFFFGG